MTQAGKQVLKTVATIVVAFVAGAVVTYSVTDNYKAKVVDQVAEETIESFEKANYKTDGKYIIDAKGNKWQIVKGKTAKLKAVK